MSKPARTGRGRLSSIDLLPEEAEEDKIWALEQLRDYARPQTEILDELNDRLAAKKLGPISKSAFSRFAVRKAIQFRRLDDVQRISGELVTSLGAEGPDQVTVAVAEMIKVLTFELLETGEIGTKGVMELSRALQSAVSAQRGSEEYRKQIERRAAAKLEQAVDKAARGAGLSAERAAELRREVLGVQGG